MGFYGYRCRRANEWTTIPVPSNWELQGFGKYNDGLDKDKADETGIYNPSCALDREKNFHRI